MNRIKDGVGVVPTLVLSVLPVIISKETLRQPGSWAIVIPRGSCDGGRLRGDTDDGALGWWAVSTLPDWPTRGDCILPGFDENEWPVPS